jgi:hypothetical protein
MYDVQKWPEHRMVRARVASHIFDGKLLASSDTVSPLCRYDLPGLHAFGSTIYVVRQQVLLLTVRPNIHQLHALNLTWVTLLQRRRAQSYFPYGTSSRVH